MVKFIQKSILALFLIVAPIFVQAFETPAGYAILLDYNTGKVIYSKNTDMKMAPSSMSKLMTLYVVFSELKSGRLKLEDLVFITENAWKAEGSRMFVEPNTKVSVSDLLRGIIIQSGNDASIAIAEHISGEERVFVERMNKEADNIGLNRSHFANATGLPHSDHYMTAYDLAKLSAILIREFPEYYSLFSEKSFTFNNITQPNRNYEIGEHGIDGLKTGHTSIAGYGIAASAVNNGRRLIAVVNGLDSEYKRLDEVKKLFAYGFGNFYNYKLASANVAIAQIPVWHGHQSHVNIVALEDLELVLPKDVAVDRIKAVLKAPAIIDAPIAKNDPIATLQVYLVEDDSLEFKLYPDEDIKQASFIHRLYGNLVARVYGQPYTSCK